MNNELVTQLEEISNALCEEKDPKEFQKFMLAFVFYRFLSAKAETLLDNTIDENLRPNYKVTMKYVDTIEYGITRELGYYIAPLYYYSALLERSLEGTDIITNLSEGFSALEKSPVGLKFEQDFSNLFSNLDFNTEQLGSTEEARNVSVIKMLIVLKDIEYDPKVDMLNDAYDSILKKLKLKK